MGPEVAAALRGPWPAPPRAFLLSGSPPERTLTDDEGRVRYTVQTSPARLHAQLRVSDAAGQGVAEVHRRLTRPESFAVERPGRLTATLSRAAHGRRSETWVLRERDLPPIEVVWAPEEARVVARGVTVAALVRLEDAPPDPRPYVSTEPGATSLLLVTPGSDVVLTLVAAVTPDEAPH